MLAGCPISIGWNHSVLCRLSVVLLHSLFSSLHDGQHEKQQGVHVVSFCACLLFSSSYSTSFPWMTWVDASASPRLVFHGDFTSTPVMCTDNPATPCKEYLHTLGWLKRGECR
ncbi:unnamed protein product [Durusdinium trenchii]|uniref:Secreted protein n=1 Tax=Durusdinium trenchii TaxID=1381693 RepID=A0ABP0Q6G6_9DINO